MSQKFAALREFTAELLNRKLGSFAGRGRYRQGRRFHPYWGKLRQPKIESGQLIRDVRFGADSQFVNLIPQWRTELGIDTKNPHYIAWAMGTMPDAVFADWVEENGTNAELAVAVSNRLRYGRDEEGFREHCRSLGLVFAA